MKERRFLLLEVITWAPSNRQPKPITTDRWNKSRMKMRTLTHFFANSSCVYISSLSCRAAAAVARRALHDVKEILVLCCVFSQWNETQERETRQRVGAEKSSLSLAGHSTQSGFFRCESADRIYDDDDEGSPRDTIHAKIYWMRETTTVGTDWN